MVTAVTTVTVRQNRWYRTYSFSTPYLEAEIVYKRESHTCDEFNYNMIMYKYHLGNTNFVH